jgi:hypothetical protein
MNSMTAARSRRRLFPLMPQPHLLGRHLLAATAFAFSFLFLVLVLISTSPSSPSSHNHVTTRFSSLPPRPIHHCGGAGSLGELGEALVSMLPTDLPFTVFAPSADAFRRVLNLRRPNRTAAHAVEKKQTTADDDTESEDTYAVLSRVLGFSAVPRRLLAADVPGSARGVVLDSVSGLRIHVARDGAALVANGVRSECIDVVRGEAVVHIIAGVLMDADFERSWIPRAFN